MSMRVSATVLSIACILVASTGDFCFRCNGLYGQISFDSKDDQKADAKYKEAIKGVLPKNLSVVHVRCCLFNQDFGLVFSSSVIETDYFWKCTQIPLGQHISKYQLDEYDALKWESAQVIQNFFEDPTAVVQYDKNQNSGLNKFFSKNSKWIWATVNGSVPVYDSQNRFCVYCKGHTKNFVPRELFGWQSSSSKKGLELFGINYKEFKLAFELLPASLNNGNCTGARVIMAIASGHNSLIAIFGTETDLVSQLWQCTSNEIDSSCVRLSEVAMYPLKCHMFNAVWIVIRTSGHLSLGVGRVLHRNVGILVKLKTGYETIKEFRVDHTSNQKQKDKNCSPKLRIYRSLKDNRCIFHEDELNLLQPCGDGYITDEHLCLECGCCFYPAHLLRLRVSKDYAACYRPFSSLEHSGHEAYMPSCNRSFHEIIKNVSLAIRPKENIKLFENVTFVISIQNMPAIVRVELKFGDGLTENNVVLVKNAQIPDWAFVVYSSDFYFGTVVHQYTLPAPVASSSLHDCLQKSCIGYFATLAVIGRGGDRVEVLQFVEGGDVPFEAQIFTRPESGKGNMTIWAVVSKLEVPISLVQAWMEFDGSNVSVSLEQNLNMPDWLSSHYKPDDFAVILNHVFNTKTSAVIKLHLLLPNAVHYSVEAPLVEPFQDQIGYYDVITDANKRSFFHLYENITFLLRIQTSAEVVAALQFGDGKILQNIKISRNFSLEDIPEWAIPFTRDSSLCTTFVFHRFTNPGKYVVRLEISGALNSSNTLFNETRVHISSFAESLGKVVLIGNASGTVAPYDTVSFIVLVENIVSSALAVLKLDEDSATLYTRFSKSSKVEYEGVWYNAVTVTYAFYKPGRHNVTFTVKDGYNSSNQVSSVATTEILVNRIQDAIGEVCLYMNESKLNLINTVVEFFVLVQRRFRHMRLHASTGDGHTVDFIQVNVKQQLPPWLKVVPSKSSYLKGGFSHMYSNAGTYLVQAVAEDSLKSRPDYSTALLKVTVQDPLPGTMTNTAENDKVSLGIVENLGYNTSFYKQTGKSGTSVFHTRALGVPVVGPTLASSKRPGTLKGESDTSQEKHEYTRNFSDEKSSTASIGQHYTLKGTDMTKDHGLATRFSVSDHSSTSSETWFTVNITDTDDMQYTQHDTDSEDAAGGLEKNVSAVNSNANNITQQGITTDENHGFQSNLRESDIDSGKASVTYQQNFTMANDGGEIYSSPIPGIGVEALHSGMDLHKTTVDPEYSLHSTSNEENGENQAPVDYNDAVIPKLTISQTGKYEDTVLHASEDFAQVQNLSTEVITSSELKEKAEISQETSKDGDYGSNLTKPEKIFSKEIEVQLTTLDYDSTMSKDEKKIPERVGDVKQDFNLITSGELDVGGVTAAYPSSTASPTDVTPKHSKKTVELPDASLVIQTVTFEDLETFDSTLTAKDWDTTAFSALSYTGTSDNHTSISEDDFHGGEKYTKKIHSPNGFRSTEIISDTQKLTFGNEKSFVTTTVNPETSSEKETSDVNESSEGISEDGEKVIATNAMEEQDVQKQNLSITVDEGKATKVYNETVTSDKNSLVATAEKQHTKEDELKFGTKQNTSETSYESTKSQNVSGLEILSPGIEKETGFPGSKTASPTVTEIKSIVPDKGIIPSDSELIYPSTNELNEIISGLANGTGLDETEITSPSIPEFKSITPGKSVPSNFGTGFPDTQSTSLLIPVLKGTVHGSGKEMLVDGIKRKPTEKPLQEAEHDVKSTSSPPYSDLACVVVYIATPGIATFLILLENVTKNLTGEVLFGDSRRENFTFDGLTSDFPDWLLEAHAKDGSSQKAIRTHAYPDSNRTYEAKFIIHDDIGHGFWKIITFQAQSCPETELVIRVNNKTNEKCFQLYAKDSIFLSLHLPVCLLTKTTRSKWIISRILAQGNSTEYLVTDNVSSTVVHDILNYTILPFSLEAASYTIEALVNSKDEFGTIVGLSKASICISLELTHLQAVAVAGKQHYRINETIVIDASQTLDPDQPFSNSGMEFAWFCSTNNIRRDTSNETKSTDCFDDDSTVLGFSGTTLIFPATQLRFSLLPANYFVTVVVRKSGRESASATVQISLFVGDPPSCTISCLYNCNTNIDVHQLLILLASCNNCHRTEQLSYSWTFASLQASNKLAGVSSREVLMEYNTARCAVKAELFSMANFFEEYQINVRVTRVDGTYNWASYPVRITTLFAEELSANAVKSRYAYLKVEQGQQESDDMGPLIATIVGVVAGVLAFAGAAYLVKRHLSRKASDDTRKPPEGNNEPPTQSTASTSAATSAHTKDQLN